MKFNSLTLLAFLLLSSTLPSTIFAQNACDKSLVTQKVKEVCTTIATTGEIPNIKFDCGGLNYVWVHQEIDDKTIVFLSHPTLERFKKDFPADNKWGHNVYALADKSTDEKKNMIMQIVNAPVKDKKVGKDGVGEGHWAGSYYWLKPGAANPGKKISYVMSCKNSKTNEVLVAGAGIWE
ncbi:MAG: hypothetical protein HQK51_04200 [Oligoflexia bacterium]|nr:hypothetical protein [Oligoflexia bacterium]